MNSINLDEKLSFNLCNFNDNICKKYIEEFFNKFNYNITVSFVEKKEICYSVYDFLIALNSQKENFSLKLTELFGDKIFFFKKEKKLKISEDYKKEILSLLLEIPHFVSVAKQEKVFLDSEKDYLKNSCFYKNGFIYFNLKGIEKYIMAVQNLLFSIGIKVFTTLEDNNFYIKFPVERLFLLGFSNYDVSVIIHFVISSFKYLYAMDNCGEDFIKKRNLRTELEKWKISSKNTVLDLLKKY